MFFRKYYLPWTAGAQFSSDDDFQAWLQKRLKRFSSLRLGALAVAAAALLAGYILDSHLIMMVTIAPLCVVLLLSYAMEKTGAEVRE